MSQPDADLFAALARRLSSEPDRDGVLRRVVTASVAEIDGAEHAGITVLTPRSVTTPVSSSDLVRDVDRMQYATGQGPCLSAATQGEAVVRVDDLQADVRWPAFAAAIEGSGVRSMLSFQLYTDTGTPADTIGALNVYATAPNAFTLESVHTGTLLAAHAAVAAAAAAESANLRIALQSRDAIGQAKGILMERYRLSPEHAFDVLIAASQNTNRKLRDVAEQLTSTGELVGRGGRV